MKSLLLFASLHAACFGMEWKPFSFCTETHQVDSIRTLVWIDESLVPEGAPYRGTLKFGYHPGTCFPARTEEKPYYMDDTLVVEAELSADRRRQDYRWIVPGPLEERPHGTTWYSASGLQDSSYLYTSNRVEGQATIRVVSREVYLRTPQFLTLTHSIRRGEGPWQEYAKDSVTRSGEVTWVHTTDEEGSWVTRCAAEGSTYVCTPTPVGDGSFDLNKEVWHLTGNRPDSLRTYRPDGRLESTEYWSWSSRSGASIRRSPPRFRPRSAPNLAKFNLLGRLSQEK